MEALIFVIGAFLLLVTLDVLSLYLKNPQSYLDFWREQHEHEYYPKLGNRIKSKR